MKTRTFLYYAIRSLNIALSAGIIICCLFFGYIFYCNVTQMPAPKLGPVSMYVVISDSMVPAFQTNDAIFVAETKPEKLEVGDIIAFYAFEDNVTITHRITGKELTPEGYSFRTQGDNNNTEDLFVTPDSKLIGRYLFQIPRLNFYIEHIQKQPYLIIIPVILLVVIQGTFTFMERTLKPVKEKDGSQAVEKGEVAGEGEAPDEKEAQKTHAQVE